MTSGVRSGSGSHVQQAMPDGIRRQTLSERTGIHGNVRVLDQKAREKGFAPEKVMDVYRKAKTDGDVKLQSALENADRNKFQTIKREDIEKRYYLPLGHLGKGSHHEVSLGLRSEGTVAAVQKPHSSRRAHNVPPQELKYHEATKGCPNVIQVIEYANGQCFLELADGDLSKVTQSGAAPLNNAPDLILGCIKAGEQLAEQQVMHLDIKPDNLLIGKDGEVKAADFEMASMVNEYGIATENLLRGNLHFYSPERRAMAFGAPRHPVGLQDNVWALMHVICEIATKSSTSWCKLSPDFQQRLRQYEQVIEQGHQAGLKAGALWSPAYHKTMHQHIYYSLSLLPNGNLFEGLTPQTPIDDIVMRMAATDPHQRISIKGAGALMRIAMSHPSTYLAAQQNLLSTLPSAPSQPIQPAPQQHYPPMLPQQQHVAPQQQVQTINPPKDHFTLVHEKRIKIEKEIKDTEMLIEYRKNGYPINLSFDLNDHHLQLRLELIKILDEEIAILKRMNGI
ncbi:MAG: protein kinase [Parachlamydiales bacterium]